MVGPALYMTAVESAPPQEGVREWGERLGRHCMRVFGMTAAERAQNDLPPPMDLREALAAPGGRLAALLEEAKREEEEQKARRAGLLTAVPPGLDPRAKSEHSSRGHGFKGLTVAGRRAIRDACALLREHKDCLAFGTVTLPDDAAEACSRDQLATFQHRWLQDATRLLRRRGLPERIVLVAEIHPHRRTMAGGPIVHWHWCAPVRHGYGEKWAATVADWHRVTAAAHFSAFGWKRGNTDGCRTEAARTDPGKYLSKYLAKGCSLTGSFVGTHWERCIPKQWWTWSGELRELVKACRIKPPQGFLRWCCRWARELIDLGAVRSELIQIGEDGPIVGRWFNWASEEELDRAIEAWIAEEVALMDWIETTPTGSGPPPT
jgi:hypothetical protein